MASIVLELQREALDRSVKVSDLLRKALVVAKKLGVTTFEEWTTHELNGYDLVKDIPAYRTVRGQVKAQNPYHGWVPVTFEDGEQAERASRQACGTPAAELEALADKSTPTSIIGLPLPHATQVAMGLPVSLIVSSATLVGILDVVRTVVLNWALKLEQDGIVGEGLSFSRSEREAAAHTSYNVVNFFGPVEQSQLQQGSNQAMQAVTQRGPDLEAVARFVAALRSDLEKLELPAAVKAELLADIQTVENQVHSPKPKPTIIREGLMSLRKVLETAAGAVAAKLLQQLVGLSP